MGSMKSFRELSKKKKSLRNLNRASQLVEEARQ
jgi:hypothetical protein